MRHVTRILASCGLYKWAPGLSHEKREFYLHRGSMIHRATALYDEGLLDWYNLDKRIKPYVEAYKRFLAESGAKPLLIEQYVVNKKLGYCGTLDRIYGKSALWPTGRLLVDIKTTEATAVTRLQTMAYKLAYGARRPIARGFVALRKDGTYKAGIYTEGAVDKAAWMACLQLVNWRERTGETDDNENDERDDSD